MEHVSLELEELAPRKVASLLADHREAMIDSACRRIADGRTMVRRNAALVLSLVDPMDPKALARLDVARKDADPIVRRHAITAFSATGVDDDVAVRSLVRGLNDDDDGVAQLAIDGLERVLAKARPAAWMQAVDLLGDASFVTLIRATPLFRRLGERAIVTLTAAMAHHNGTIRRWARETLQGLGEKSVPILIDALERPALREAAVRTLEGMSEFGEHHVERVAGLVGGPDPDTQAAAFRALAAIHKALERRRQRPATVDHPEFYKRSLSAKQLAAAKDGTRAEDLLWNLRDGRWYVRANSVTLMALAAHKDDSRDALAAALKPLLRDTDLHVRCTTIRNLARIVGRRAIPMLITATADPEPRVAAEAKQELNEVAPRAIEATVRALGGVRREDELTHTLEALAGAGDKALPPLVSQLVGGSSPLARAAAVLGIAQLRGRDPECRDALLRALHDPDERVRLRAASTLGGLFRADTEVFQALRTLAAEESHSEVRRAAALAADRVAGREPAPRVKAPARLPSAAFAERTLTDEELTTLGEAASLETLRTLTGDGRDLVRANTAAALGLDPATGDDEDLVRWLVLSLKDGAPEVRAAAARALGVSRPPPMTVVPPLAKALVNADHELEAALLDALLAYGRGAIGPALEALTDRFQMTRADVARVAAHIPNSLVRPLAHYVHRPARYSVRGLAADLLAAMGERAADAWEDLSVAVEEPLGTLRTKLVRAIGRCAAPSVNVYEALLIVGNYDNRASVKLAVEEAIEELIARLSPEDVAAVGGHAALRDAWFREVTHSAARVRR